MKHPDFPMFKKSIINTPTCKNDWDCLRFEWGSLLCWVEPTTNGWYACDTRDGLRAGPFDTAEQAMAYYVLMGWTQP